MNDIANKDVKPFGQKREKKTNNLTEKIIGSSGVKFSFSGKFICLLQYFRRIDALYNKPTTLYQFFPIEISIRFFFHTYLG